LGNGAGRGQRGKKIPGKKDPGQTRKKRIPLSGHEGTGKNKGKGVEKKTFRKKFGGGLSRYSSRALSVVPGSRTGLKRKGREGVIRADVIAGRLCGRTLTNDQEWEPWVEGQKYGSKKSSSGKKTFKLKWDGEGTSVGGGGGGAEKIKAETWGKGKQSEVRSGQELNSSQYQNKESREEDSGMGWPATVRVDMISHKKEGKEKRKKESYEGTVRRNNCA